MTECPCGSKQSLADCCGRLIDHISPAPTAEALMRSRYTAYTFADTAYLQKTSGTGNFDAVGTKQWAAQITWLGLNILSVVAGKKEDKTGEVTYVARYLDHGRERTIAEKALFERIAGEWKYVGPKPVPSSQPATNVGRNEPCPCGSGKKYKKCCG